MNDSYTILLRRDGQAFIVADARGDHYVYAGEIFVCRFGGECSLERFLPRLLALGWVKVPTVSPYTQDGLRQLLGPAIAA